ncbi:PREDICTED: F-box protein FBW2-like [Populus euphratica]|uniref:F-box protein FBW2-like n=1 Tax=Populus euphratica TaxID=75702 RepID=A0AAJ6T1U2_POPEU|nr:PREDICTED: F-box protein FBW2-like [Populus euphratica]XP_011003035.1 PREDICTED: F-box protein FBW2-like [Populus euphratica]XP_011003036.1 PREDICTED: F-box protein FBW2-like [Populus euphratica]
MEDGDESRHWDELIPDALGLIFSHLSLQEILTVVPRVCKSWSRAVSGPYCWQEINIEEWTTRCHPDHLDRMLQMLITRSRGSLRKLCVSGLHNDTTFLFLADHAASLQTLRIPRSDISDLIVEQIAGRLSTITFLDVSYCTKISGCALEAIGKHCKLLVGLCRNMHPLDTEGMETQDDEAYAIATTMPKLKRLEMVYHLVSTESLLQILSSCTELEFMDLRGCWNVNLDDKFFKESFAKLTVLRPFAMEDFYVTNDWEEYSDDYDDEGRLEELELRFYEGEDAELYGWYPSP